MGNQQQPVIGHTLVQPRSHELRDIEFNAINPGAVLAYSCGNGIEIVAQPRQCCGFIFPCREYF